MALSTDKILHSAAKMAKRMKLQSAVRHLDIGPGHGELIEILRTDLKLTSDACDYTDTLMQLSDVRVDVRDLNIEKLPYMDGTYDLVTCTEVLEHLEHYRETLREVYRVMKPDGVFVLTTPNILNLKSRIRFMVFGFYNLFGPLHFNESELHSAGGHINPIGLYFLIHSLVDAGFKNIQVDIDKRQGTSFLWLLFLYLPIKSISFFVKRREKSRFKTIDRHNERYVDMINRVDILLGRTLIIGCNR
jgi:2-polyprenyl-3-methyl-5-hydroxy-6-metoxy-1,4-benzoquinol methylase